MSIRKATVSILVLILISIAFITLSCFSLLNRLLRMTILITLTCYLGQPHKELPEAAGFWFAWYAFHPATEIFVVEQK